eukprot:3776273-Amphidinium_carterae.1
MSLRLWRSVGWETESTFNNVGSTCCGNGVSGEHVGSTMSDDETNTKGCTKYPGFPMCRSINKAAYWVVVWQPIRTDYYSVVVASAHLSHAHDTPEEEVVALRTKVRSQPAHSCLSEAAW